MPKLNICVVGLTKNLTDKVCSDLSTMLEMYYANVEKILEFELFDYENIEKICGKEYLIREERAIIRRVCSYEDTLINLDYTSLNNDDLLQFIKDHCLLIYLHIDYDRFIKDYENEHFSINKRLLDISLYGDRDKLCKEEADIVIDCKNEDITSLTNIISEKIINYYS